jgi:hypothetical protein
MQNDQSKNGQPVSVGSTGGSAPVDIKTAYAVIFPPVHAMMVACDWIESLFKRKPRQCAHRFKPIGHIYKNHTPAGMAIYNECEICGHVESSSLRYASLDRTTEMPSSGKPNIGDVGRAESAPTQTDQP